LKSEDKKMANGNIEPTEPNSNIYPGKSPDPFSEVYSAPTPPSHYGETSEPKPGRKAIKTIIGLIVGILFFSTVGASIALYIRAWDPLWSPFRPEPDKVIQEMSQTMEKLKTVHSETKVDFEAQNEFMPIKFQMDLKDDTDKTDSKNLKSAGKFNLLFNISAVEYSLSGESKNLNKISFLKLDIIPGPVITFLREMLGFNWSSVGGKWIKIDPESLAESLPDIIKKFLSADEQVMMEELFQKQETMEISEEKQKEIEDKIKKITSGKKFFIVKKELADTDIGGVKMYHYIMTLDRKEVKSTIPDIVILFFDTAKDLNPELFQTMTEEEEYDAKKDIVDGLNKSFDEFFSKVGDIDGEVWIGKKDYLLYKVKIDKEIDLNQISEGSEGKIIFKLDTDISNFDKPVLIEEPKGSKPLEDILLEIANGLINIRIRDSLSGVRWEASDLNYGYHSFENLCTEPPTSTLNGKAPSYIGSSLSRIKKEITAFQGGNLDLVCLDSVTSYCVQTKLINMEKRFCIDSGGEQKIIEKNQNCIGNGTSTNPYKCP
jgi:hypothetical protein